MYNKGENALLRTFCPFFCRICWKERKKLQAYLDNSATTQVLPEVVEKLAFMLSDCYGNPSSLHRMGVAAEREMEAAREKVAASLGASREEIVFTSGATESNNIALFSAAFIHAKRKGSGRRIVTTATEHPSVSCVMDELEKNGFEVVRIRPEGDGVVDAQVFADAVDEHTVLASMMFVNNETGAINPVEKATQLIKRKNPSVHVHIDAVQGFMKLPIRVRMMGADTLAVSAHKIHGPKGIGALYIKKGVRVLPRTFGGGQEKNIRPGTESTPLIAAFGKAVEVMHPLLSEHYSRVKALSDRLRSKLAGIEGITVNSAPQALPYIVNLSVPGIRSEILLHFLEERGIFVSSGSACSKGHKSPVLTAMGLSPHLIDSALRISFSALNTPQQVDYLVDCLQEGMQSIQRRSL